MIHTMILSQMASASLEQIFYLAISELFWVMALVLKAYYIFVNIRGLLNWFPIINPYIHPWYILLAGTEPYFKLFEKWLPILCGIDLAWVIGYIVLDFSIRLAFDFSHLFRLMAYS